VCGTGRRIDLGPVMHLQNFDIEIVIQRLRDALDHCRQQIDPRLILPDLTTMARVVTLLITASSDTERPVVPMNVDQAPLGGDGDIGNGGGGHGEVEDAVGVRRQRPQIGREQDPIGGQARQDPGILAQQFRAGRFQRAVRTAPGVSAMTRVSARPIRPPAPATIKRMSDIFRTSPLRIAGAGSSGNQSGFRLRLRPVVTFDDHEVASRGDCGSRPGERIPVNCSRRARFHNP